MDLLVVPETAPAVDVDGPIPLELSADDLCRKLEGQERVYFACTCAKAGADEAPIAGSMSRDEFHAVLGTLAPDADIALYCNSCVDDFCARWTAAALRRGGYRGARVLTGGADGWREGGFPAKSR